ncbi:MAG: DNA alkylation repair protein [Methanobacteriota archaeon]
MKFEDILSELERLRDPSNIEGMKRFGITPDHTFGVRLPDLRRIAKEAGRDHELALKLWAKDTRETRILAAMIAEPKKTSSELMDSWASEFAYWEICDQCCMNLFWLTPIAYEKACEWSESDEEYVKRAGFALVAVLAWKDKLVLDEKLEEFFPYIKQGSIDERPIVKKAVNWALRQIGKRNRALNSKAIKLAREIELIDSKASRWVAGDALRELCGDAVQKRLT